MQFHSCHHLLASFLASSPWAHQGLIRLVWSSLFFRRCSFRQEFGFPNHGFWVGGSWPWFFSLRFFSVDFFRLVTGHPFFGGPKLAACASIRKLGDSRWRTGLELSSSRVYTLLLRVYTVGWGDQRLKGTQKRYSTIYILKLSRETRIPPS